MDQLFAETDKHLNQDVSIVLIGGTALVIKYLSPRSTLDVDTYNRIPKILLGAWKKAEENIKIHIPLAQSTVAEGPYLMEDRFTIYKDLDLKYLKIFIPEAADIIMMKLIRLLSKDRDDISHLIKSEKISDALLLKRFTEEMTHIIGNFKIIKSHYLFIIEENYGNKIADKHQKKIKHL
ncbi:MAG: DUF6036 family nucleotidyltransferase [Pseudobdellovibrionaceae bacterium]